MPPQNLEQILRSVSSPVGMLRNSQIGPYAFPVVRHEFTNWRDEQRSWRHTCALFDQSHHMTDLYVEGPDALALVSALAVNTFRGFRVDQAKQFIACNPDGYVIGDAILFHLAENSLSLVGRPPAANWVEFNARSGQYDVRVERDERTVANQGRRKTYRFQVQGPTAARVMEDATKGPMPDIRFFNMATCTIAGRPVRALRHGMVGQPGWELFGPWEDGDAVRDAIVTAGRAHGLLQVGARTYPTSCLESGWIPSPLPAIYTSATLEAYRTWLSPTSYEAMASLGGSFTSDRIEDYYLTPWDLGYGPFVKFDHEFVGRRALETMSAHPPRRKVTLVWNGEDVERALGSLFTSRGDDIAKYIDLPLANYATLPYDRIESGGRTVGLSTYTGYNFNERAMLSLAVIENAFIEPGTEVSVVWGEDDGGTSKPTVEHHVQATIRATVQPAPISDVARLAYRPTALA